MDLWIFDNDGTLYDDTNTRKQFREIFYQYCSKVLGVSQECASEEVARLRTKWNTAFSAVALKKEFGLDYAEIVNQTYFKVDFEKCGVSNIDPVRGRALSAITAPKIVFTNNPSMYARKVLKYLGLLEYFVDIIGTEETEFIGKPNPAAFKTIEQRYPQFNRFIFCDDLVENLDAAKSLGWTTIWFKPQNVDKENQTKHIVVSSFEDLKFVV